MTAIFHSSVALTCNWNHVLVDSRQWNENMRVLINMQTITRCQARSNLQAFLTKTCHILTAIEPLKSKKKGKGRIEVDCIELKSTVLLIRVIFVCINMQAGSYILSASRFNLFLHDECSCSWRTFGVPCGGTRCTKVPQITLPFPTPFRLFVFVSDIVCS